MCEVLRLESARKRSPCDPRRAKHVKSEKENYTTEERLALPRNAENLQLQAEEEESLLIAATGQLGRPAHCRTNKRLASSHSREGARKGRSIHVTVLAAARGIVDDSTAQSVTVSTKGSLGNSAGSDSTSARSAAGFKGTMRVSTGLINYAAVTRTLAARSSTKAGAPYSSRRAGSKSPSPWCQSVEKALSGKGFLPVGAHRYDRLHTPGNAYAFSGANGTSVFENADNYMPALLTRS